MSAQVDQIQCDTCGALPIRARDTLRTATDRARRHARAERHDVHVLLSDSRHYLGASYDDAAPRR